MPSKNESKFAEVILDRLLLESIPSSGSAYYQEECEKSQKDHLYKIKSKVHWHINHSLSRRQKQVLKLVVQGKKEREIAEILGITQQVVNIYKHRAIRKLRDIIF